MCRYFLLGISGGVGDGGDATGGFIEAPQSHVPLFPLRLMPE